MNQEKKIATEDTGVRESGITPLITVVTVVFNGAAHLEQAIKSVISQSYDNIEYIVIDGGSTDGTLDILRQYENHIASWTSEPDKGIYDAMNKGIDKATGRFIGILNADDWYEPGIIGEVANRVANASSSSENRVIYSDYYWYDEELSPGLKTKKTSEMKYWKGMTISHQAMFVPAAVYKKLGPYSLEYRFASDYEYFLRMITNRVDFEKIDIHGVNFRRGGSSTAYMNRSISEVSKIVRAYFGVFSKEYLLFLLTNRLPSMLANTRYLFSKLVGENTTIKLRKKWHRLKPGVDREEIR